VRNPIYVAVVAIVLGQVGMRAERAHVAMKQA